MKNVSLTALYIITAVLILGVMAAVLLGAPAFTTTVLGSIGAIYLGWQIRLARQNRT